VLKNLVFTVLVPGTVAGVVPYQIVSRAGLPPLDAVRLVLAVPLAAVGLCGYIWCVWDFIVIGRATPAPIDPPQHLVARGLYRWVRNPMYVGVWLVVAAWALAFRSSAGLAYGVVVAVVCHLFVVGVEEPLLRRRFGAAYEAYYRAVPRWVPRPPHRPHGPDRGD
jgi:protein-S-isoprenylcysteine O-methyltransferase Ste14